jgi:uncharacterized membrane protein
MLRHPLIALIALFAHIFRTTESPIAGPAPFPDLVRLVRLVRTFLQRDRHGERTVVAGWHHLNGLMALMALMAHTFPRHTWQSEAVDATH